MLSQTLTCVVDKDVQPLLSLQEALTEVSYGAHVGQVQLLVQHVDTVAPDLDVPHRLLSPSTDVPSSACPFSVSEVPWGKTTVFPLSRLAKRGCVCVCVGWDVL